MSVERAHPNYTAVWLWLLVLLGVGLAASFLPGGRSVALVVIFATAVVRHCWWRSASCISGSSRA
jgi:hypothetical protein